MTYAGVLSLHQASNNAMSLSLMIGEKHFNMPDNGTQPNDINAIQSNN